MATVSQIYMAIVSKVRLGDLKLHSGGIHHDPSERVKGIEPIIPRLHEPGQCPSLLGSASSLTAGQMMINCNSLKKMIFGNPRDCTR